MRKQSLSDIVSRAGQIFGIAIMATWCFFIVYKGVSDALGIAQNNPGDFYRSFARYLLSNIGG